MLAPHGSGVVPAVDGGFAPGWTARCRPTRHRFALGGPWPATAPIDRIVGAVSPPDGFRFESADPCRPPATELLAAMTREMTELYGQADRLDRPALTAADLGAPGGDYLVGRLDGEPVAGGGVRRLGPGVAEIKRMYVMPAHRNRGIAVALLHALEVRARGLGYSAVRLDTGPLQPRAVAIYQRAGYRRIEPYNDNPYAAFWGEKLLEAGEADAEDVGRAPSGR